MNQFIHFLYLASFIAGPNKNRSKSKQPFAHIHVSNFEFPVDLTWMFLDGGGSRTNWKEATQTQHVKSTQKGPMPGRRL